MADTTVITFTQNPLQELLALQGIRFEVGGTALQYAPINNSNVTIDGTLGWRNFGLLEGTASFKQTFTFFDGEVGQVGKNMTNLETSRKAEGDISVTCATFTGQRFALGSGPSLFTITEPTSPVTTTIDESPPAATNFQITVASTSGFTVGDEIGIPTGNATYGVEEEFRVIKEIVSATVLNLVEPLDQLPADGVTVRKIKSKLIKVQVGSMPVDFQVRAIKYNRSYANRLRVAYAAHASLADPTGIDDGDGKVAAKMGFKIKILSDYDVPTASFNLMQYKWINP